MSPKLRSFLAGYGLAIASTLVATWLRMLIHPYLGTQVIFITYFPAVFVTALYAGFGPALAAVLMSATAAAYFFIPPDDSLLPPDLVNWASLGLFGFFGVGVGLLSEGMRRKASLAQRERERFFVTLASIGDAVIVTDQRCRITFLNSVAEQFTGWTREAALRMPLDTVFHIVNEQTRQPIENPVAKCLREGRIVGLANHAVLIAKNGSERAVDDTAAPIRERDGSVVGVVLVFRDTSEQRAAQIERGRLAALVDSSEDAIIGQTFEGVVTTWNVGAERLFDFSAEEVVGKSIFSMLVPADQKKQLTQALQRVQRGERIDAFETLRRCKDGRLIPIAVQISPICNAKGEAIGASAIDRDISQQRIAERRRNARLAITQIFAQERNVDQAVVDFLMTVCGALEWTVGCFWHVDPHDQLLRCRECWPGSRQELAEFRSKTQSLALPPGESLPGRVWMTGQATWIADVCTEPNFARAAEAKKVGLHGGFACPVSVDDEFLGVIEFFSHEIRQPDDDLLEMMASVGGQMGQFIERRQAERKLRRSEHELTDFFENAAVGLHWVGKDGTILRVNQAELNMLGYTHDEYVGHHIAEFHADQPVINNILQRLTVGEQLHDCEARLKCKDGSTKDVRIDSNVFWENGQFVHSRCFTRDVSQRKRAEASLQESEERLRMALEAGRLGTWEWHIPTGKVIWSPTLEAIHGLSPGDFPGTFDAYQMDIHPQDRQHVLETIRQTVEERQDHHLEYRIVWPDGSERWVEAKGKLFLDSSGKPLRVMGACSDITARKWMEQSLRFLAEASKSLATVVDYKSTLQSVAQLAVPDFADWCAVDIVDSDGILQRLAVAHIEPAKVQLAEELHRRYPPDPDAMYGITNVLRTGESEMAVRISDSMLAESANDDEHLRILRELALKSYICVPLRVQQRTLGVITFVSAESGRVYGDDELGMANDLAHRAAIAIENALLYQKLQEADRRKDEFLAMLAHELRNPLVPIRSGLDLISMDAGDHHETVTLMQQQLEQVVRLVDDLLDVSRIMRGKVELRRESIELAELVGRSVDSVSSVIDGREQKLTVELPDQPLWLNADPVRIVQVLGNLLNNASKYMDSGGRIDLNVQREDADAVISVRDTGIGIDTDLLPKVFELFTQSSRSLDRAQGGLGIGLTLVQRLVQMHGGTVSAASDGPGCGSTFVVRLPLAKIPTVVADTITPNNEDKALTQISLARRIVVVDDNVSGAWLLSKLLAKLGDHEITLVHDGPSALETIKETHPEIVLLDIGLPGMDGYQVGRAIRMLPELDDVLLIALTGYGQEEDRQRSKAAGFDEHLVKPPSIDQMKSILSHPKLQRASQK